MIPLVGGAGRAAEGVLQLVQRDGQVIGGIGYGSRFPWQRPARRS